MELSTLLTLCFIAMSLWGFMELAGEVFEGETRNIDTQLLLALRTPGDPTDPLGPPWVEEVGRDMTALGGLLVVTLATVATALFFLLSGRYRSALYMLVVIGGGVTVSNTAKGIFSRPRPDLVPHGSIVHTASFPSGHSMMAAVVYLTLAVMVARILPEMRLKIYVLSVAVFVTVMVGVSRVYLGVHWPTDVLAGWLAGASWAVMCLLGARVLARFGKVEPEAHEEEA
ncbi:phosphatase PAP2 family protein [Tropicimonas isoalkanivorans]|uniref:Undecaprenyl-diphosphatase n=1 Tax=Tropicimonas isoalkanivorans TaxID=441112 RepID=A0A1I1PKB7_9RHOB|nr:phosphatase PAP2 family protein [Tropicimonas isoalkanivorans]SFD10182.1 undecaprenyl-diphosphatase [Tropicimonas isoalkanivorans]